MSEKATTGIGMDIPGIILAGGLSSRMGTDKAGIGLGGTTLLERAARRLQPQVASLAISANGPVPDLSGLVLPMLGDPGGVRAGPLGGILSALRHAQAHHPRATHVATVPTDSPFFPVDLVARLADGIDHAGRIAVAGSSGGLHPVFGLWPVALADDLDLWLRRGAPLRLRAVLDRFAAREIVFPDLDTPRGPFDPFFNINTPADLAVAERWLGTLDP